jgi:hypothetical protein
MSGGRVSRPGAGKGGSPGLHKRQSGRPGKCPASARYGPGLDGQGAEGPKKRKEERQRRHGAGSMDRAVCTPRPMQREVCQEPRTARREAATGGARFEGGPAGAKRGMSVAGPRTPSRSRQYSALFAVPRAGSKPPACAGAGPRAGTLPRRRLCRGLVHESPVRPRAGGWTRLTTIRKYDCIQGVNVEAISAVFDGTAQAPPADI